jgi:hypothetical protein
VISVEYDNRPRIGQRSPGRGASADERGSGRADERTGRMARRSRQTPRLELPVTFYI